MSGETQIPRFCPDRALPPYSYVPGVNAHPGSDPRGHSFGVPPEKAEPLSEESYRGNATYLYAIDLFNHGFYWEAHEAWEALWHAAGRKGATADFLKGLIKLAAAGVKAREGRAAGVRQHAERAAELLGGVADTKQIFGLNLEELIRAARDAADRASELAGDGGANADRTLGVVLRLAD
jgi:predicted metal-dependent hydrolase